ncbi:MAG: glycosyltransferase family 2 protein [Thermoplasmatota archaeon]
MPSPRLSVVVLTWNERAVIEATLDALAAQTHRDFEVIVVDAASTDGTAGAVAARTATFAVPLTLLVAASRISVGEARNRGVARARAPAVAFLSADALPDAHWVERALRGVKHHDAIFGRQIHAPRRPTVAANVRSLRYDFPTEDRANALPFASHVSAVFRRDLLSRFPFGTSRSESTVDDLLLARRLAASGCSLAYDPKLVVRHSDVDDAATEFAKNRREGFAWGVHADELGLHTAALAWAALLVLTGTALVASPGVWTAVAALVALYAPAARRALRQRHTMPLGEIVSGTLATPPFDLTFLATYLAGLAAGRPRVARAERPTEAQP